MKQLVDVSATSVDTGSGYRHDLRSVGAFLSRYGVLIAFVVTIAIFSRLRPDSFATIDNARAILQTAAPALIVAMALTVPLVLGDFDLSFGSVIGLTGGVSVVLMATHGVAWPLATLVAIGIALLVGAINGLLVAYFGGSSFIITLAMGTVVTGIEFAFTQQATIFSGTAPEYRSIAQGDFLGFANTVWYAAAIGVILWLFLDHSETGRYMYAVGGNAEASRLSGLRTKGLRLVGFMVIAAGAGIVGILLTSTSGAYTPSFGLSFLLPAYAGAFLGAATSRSGQFNVPGTAVGVLFLGVIQTGLTMLNLQTYAINLVQGGILIVAVLLSRLGRRSE